MRSEEGVCFTDSGLDDNRLKRQRRGHLGPDVPTQAELDIMREKAEALGRTGQRLDECLRKLMALEERIKAVEVETRGVKELNALIGEFNNVREKAITYLHYLIIHREAIGFRRHPILEKMYRIPAKKKPLC
ncbi:MAG: hypothetical protein DRG50_07160, partial [Deltaproteobacteria bacterium]